ncbi:hypothetical protein Pmani_003662 [Petrolisthes manimaculis]|uniref:Uncharacterized protein n=1 Tax=Petrolisthes manimaculis TaxID=1843537 RepID=A0AAE1QF48_9EUCA|nr:hypothetical protein Pmani_003662 [Petrolisthes manimaculis]
MTRIGVTSGQTSNSSRKVTTTVLSSQAVLRPQVPEQWTAAVTAATSNTFLTLTQLTHRSITTSTIG